MSENTTQKKLPPDETALFCEQVAMVLKAGIPLDDGMETLAKSYEGSRYGGRFLQIRRLRENPCRVPARFPPRWRKRAFFRTISAR